MEELEDRMVTQQMDYSKMVPYIMYFETGVRAVETKFMSVIKNEITIGRAEPNNRKDIEGSTNYISRNQGRIVFDPTANMYFYHHESQKVCTYVNNELCQPGSNAIVPLTDGSVVVVGSKTNAERGNLVVVLFYVEENAQISLNVQSVAQSDDIMVERGNTGNNLVSRKHAHFTRENGNWLVEDCGSKNGVYINGVRINKAAVNNFDVLHMGGMYICYLREVMYVFSSKKYVDELVINIVDRSAGKKHLLKNINLSIKSGEMVLLLGGSGAGKTTLFNAIMGYEKAKEGNVLFGNKSIYNDYEDMKSQIGYVPQENLIRKEDTVYHTLLDEAYVKLGKTMSKDQCKERVLKTIELMGLSNHKESIISKLSGGQLKRASIAWTYISDPSLFFLDEPDSGLDGPMAKSLMRNLRLIANEGKIVMVITHAPDRVSKLFDKVIVLAKTHSVVNGEKRDNPAELAYYGPISEAKEFFGVDELEDIVQVINPRAEGGQERAKEFIDKYNSMNK